MHHCQIDRMFSTYLAKNPDTQSEYESDKDYNTHLKPFVHRYTGKPFTPSMCFDTAALGYQYDSLLPPPQQAIREPPIVAAWKNVDLAVEMAGRTYTLFVHVFPSLAAADAWTPASSPEEALAAENYAGSVVVLGGRGEGCDNCLVNRKPVNLTVDITSAVRDLGVKMHQAVIKIAVCDGFNDMVPYQSTGLNPPEVFGPSFDLDGNLVFASASDLENEGLPAVLQIQKRLLRLGHKLVADGVVGPRTKKALSSLLGLKEDEGGQMDSKSILQALSRVRHDGFADEDEDAKDDPSFKKGQKVKYWLGSIPGYLEKSRVAKEVDDSLLAWSNHVNLDFVKVGERDRADLTIEWSDRANDVDFNNEHGGALAFTDVGKSITLDICEIWQLQGDAPREVIARGHKWPCFFLLPIMIHEVGHVIGLHHSMKEGDIMLPFYDASAISLSDNDIERAVGLYGRNPEKRSFLSSLCCGSSSKVAPDT